MNKKFFEELKKKYAFTLQLATRTMSHSSRRSSAENSLEETRTEANGVRPLANRPEQMHATAPISFPGSQDDTDKKRDPPSAHRDGAHASSSAEERESESFGNKPEVQLPR